MATKRRLNQDLVVEAAVALADEQGFDAVTLAAVAARLEIRIPSLYNHVSGLAGLRYQMSVWATKTVGDAIRRAAFGKAGGDALRGIAVAYRQFAREHPGVYRLTLRAPAPDELELAEAARDVLDLLLAALKPYQLSETEMLHTVRGLRSVVHGFIDLEILGGFAMALDHDESFERLVQGYIAGIEVTHGEPT